MINPRFSTHAAAASVAAASRGAPRDIRHVLLSENDKAIAVVIVLLMLHLAIPEDAASWLFHGVVYGSITIMALCAWFTYRLLTADSKMAWTPIPWMIAAFGVYHGLGPLASVFGNHATQAYLSNFIHIGLPDVLRTTTMNLAGALGTLCGIRIAATALEFTDSLTRNHTIAAVEDRRLRTVAAWFAGTGVLFQMLIVLPYEFGQLPFTLPGSVYSLGNVVLVAVTMFAILATRHGGSWKIGLLLLTSFEFTIAFLRLSKAEIVTVLFLAAIGRYVESRRRSVLVFAGLAIAICFFVAFPIVSAARNEVVQEVGNLRDMPLLGRLAVVKQCVMDHWRGELTDSSASDLQGWWARLSYVNAETLAMQLYDSGSPGNTLKDAAIAVVPRFLWPEKPVLTDVAMDYYELSTGQYGSATAIGIYGEAYWNGGWMAVITVGMYVGLVIGFITRQTYIQVSREQWLFLPCVFMGIRIGGRIDGWIVADYVGAMAIYLAYSGFVVLYYSLADTRDISRPAQVRKLTTSQCHRPVDPRPPE